MNGSRYPSMSLHKLHITFRSVFCYTVWLCYSLGLLHRGRSKNFESKHQKDGKNFRLFFLLPRGFPEKFPNLLIDANGRVLLDPVRSIRNQAQSEVLHPSVIVTNNKKKRKSRRKLILSYGRTDGRTDVPVNPDRSDKRCMYILGRMVSHGNVEKFIFGAPDEQRRHLDHFARFAHRFGIDHRAVIVDRTGQIPYFR